MFRKLYNWTIALSASPNALWALFFVSFAESSFFPIPPDVMMVPMVLARRDQAWRIALVCTLGSVFGAMLGYAIGMFLGDTVGAWVIHAYGLTAKMDALKQSFADYGGWIIVLKGLTPIPFKLVTITSGLLGYNFLIFILLAAITRAVRFFLVAGLLRIFGEPVRHFIEKRLEWVLLGLAVVIIGGFVLAYLLA